MFWRLLAVTSVARDRPLPGRNIDLLFHCLFFQKGKVPMTSVFQIARTLTLATFAAAILAMLAAGPATAALTALYQLEGNLDDATINNLDADYGAFSGSSFTGGGTASFSSSDTPGGFSGQSLSLEGSSDALHLGNSSLLNPEGAWSFAAWTKITSAGVNYWLTETGDGTNVSANIHMNGGANGVKTNIFDSGGSNNGVNSMVGSSNPNVMDGSWHHIVVALDTTGNGGDGANRIYIDGVLEGTSGASTASIRQLSGNTYVGSDDTGGYPGYTGLIDDIAYFSHALSASEISTIMAGDFSAYPAIPEPSSLALLASGLVWGVATMRRRRRR